MKKKNNYFKAAYWVAVCAFILTGCSNNHSTDKKIIMENEKEELEEEKMEEPEVESSSVSIKADTEDSTDSIVMEPEIVDVDWSEYFNGLNGAAVVYDATNRRYTMYNGDLAVTKSSPCSTFKIISSLIALENGILEPEDSTRKWSGEIFWNEDWNKNIDFNEAFRTSCVWYYRQVIDDIGKEMMQKELNKLQYGNCDISDWEGRLNTNNNNRALTGFWIESSLMISPKEQAEVMERIFGENSDYSEETQNELKQVMLVPEQDREEGSRIEENVSIERDPKTPNSFRVLRVPEVIITELEKRKCLIEIYKEKMQENFVDNDYISCQANGKVHSLSAMNIALKKLCVRNGLRV